MERKTILLVEDDNLVRALIKEALEREYQVVEAAKYSEAIEHIRNPINLAIIDYNLPDGDGLEILKTIRNTRPGLPVIIITAYSTESLAVKAFKTGATDYIKKPLNLLSLRKRVSEILGIATL